MGNGEKESGRSAGPEVRPDRRMGLHLLVLAVVTLLVYSNTWGNAYHLDDFPRIVDNPEVDRVWPLHRHFLDPSTSSILPSIVQYRPMLPLSLSVNAALADASGIDRLTAFHLGSIGLHLGAGILFYFLFMEILVHWSGLGRPVDHRRDLAFWGALLYLVHPVAGVAVNYLCARDLLLMQIFLAGSFLCYLHARRMGGWWRWALASVLLFLSITSKTNALAAPLLVLFFELTLGGGSPRQARVWLRVLPMAGVVAFFFLFKRLALRFSDLAQLMVDRGPIDYPATQAKLHLTYYLRNFFWPFHLRPLPRLEVVEGAGWVLAAAGALFILATLWLAWRFHRRMPVGSFVILAYWVMFSPTSSVLPFRLLGTDYRQVPSLPWACLGLCLMAFLFLGGRLLQGVLVVAFLWFALTSFAMNRTWKTEESLWHQSVRYGGGPMAHYNYAMAVMGRDEALGEKHLEETLRMYPGHIWGHISLGLMRIRQGRTVEGLQLVETAVLGRPDWAVTHHWMAVAYEQAGRKAEAARSAARASDLHPRNPDYAYKAALLAQETGDFQGCLRHLERLHAVEASRDLSRFLEGYALQKVGREAEAVRAYRRFLERRPGYTQGWFNLGYALKHLERCEEALDPLHRVLELNPDYTEAHFHLAICYRDLGRDEESARHMEAWEAR